MRILKNNSQTKVRIECGFDFDEKVRIKPLNVEGTVESFWLKNGYNLLIEVRYFLENKIQKEYFYSDELEVLKEVKAGFEI